MCFLFLEALFGICGLILFVSWKILRTKSRTLVFWGAVGLLLLFLAYRRLEEGQRRWGLGLGGAQLSAGESKLAIKRMHRGGFLTMEEVEVADGVCAIKIPNWTWEDLFPSGTLNGWTGSQECPAEVPFAVWDTDGSIRVEGCPGGQRVSYQELPRTENYDWKYHKKFEGVQDFQKYVLGHSRISEAVVSNAHADATQHFVGERSEAVLVRCGESQQNLLIRNVRDEAAVGRVNAYHHHLDQKKQIEREEAQAASSHINSDTRGEPTQTPSEEERPRVNVLLLYFDALSRRHFHRRFPSTAAFLEKLKKERDDEVAVAEFFRYHAIGITTSRNARAMFTGFSLRPSSVRDLAPLNRMRFPHNYEMPPANHRYPVPIWAAYKKKGYINAQIDNSCQDWEAKYIARSTQGWDHQFVAPFCLPEYFPLRNPHGNWVGPFAIRRRCLAGSQVHQWWVVLYLSIFKGN